MASSPRIIRILRCARGARINLPVRRREETHAVRHASEPEETGAFGEAHQFMRQIERAADLVPACAFASLSRRARQVLAGVGGTETQLYEKFKQVWRNPDVLRVLKRGDVFSDRPATGIGRKNGLKRLNQLWIKALRFRPFTQRRASGMRSRREPRETIGEKMSQDPPNEMVPREAHFRLTILQDQPSMEPHSCFRLMVSSSPIRTKLLSLRPLIEGPKSPETRPLSWRAK